jgi:Ni,Fe-hydrogenase III small subunit
MIRDIEETTGRRFLVYFANRFEPNSDIDQRDISLMTEILRDLGNDPVDIMVETGGGLTDATEALISLIWNVVGDRRVVIANAAKSNGTLLCLAARSIVMGATSELGPIEPSVQGVPCSILMSPEIAKQNFPLHMFGVYALQQSRALAKRLLSAGMMSGKEETYIDAAVQALASRDKYHSHGSVIDHREAAAMGLSVDYLEPDSTLWQRIWLLYSMYDYDCRKNKYLKVFEGRAASTAVAAP